MKNKFKNKKGFTLIEVIIYIGLFAFIMTGALVSIFGILGSSARSQTKAMVQEEGSFVLGKIDWVVTGIKSASVTDGGNKLTVSKFDASLDNPISIFLDGENILIKRGTHDPQIINNSNIQISCTDKCFTHTTASGDGINPESVSANFTVNGKTENGFSYSQSFYTSKYLRK